MLKKNALSEMISLLFVLVHYCRWGLLPITRCAKCPSIQKTFVLMFFFAKCSHFTRDSPLSEIFLNLHFQHFIYTTMKKKILDKNNLRRLELIWGFLILFRVIILIFRTISQQLNSKTKFGPGLEQICLFFSPKGIQ